MPLNFVQQAFGLWLEENRKRFDHPPTQIRYVGKCVRFYFTDVIREISVMINKHGCNIAFTYQNELWDFLVCFDVSVERDTDGYYCGQCVQENDLNIAKRFNDRAELLEDHVFEPLLKWSNERLRGNVFAQIY